MRKRQIYKTHPRGWRTSLSRASSFRVCHTSYLVPVRRPACLDWASFRPHLTMTPLPFSLPSAPLIPGVRTFHLTSSVPCPAHTLILSGGGLSTLFQKGNAWSAVRLNILLGNELRSFAGPVSMADVNALTMFSFSLAVCFLLTVPFMSPVF